MVKYSSEVLALRDRVIKGNEKLFLAWQQIRDLVGEEREHQWDRWNEAQERLHYLCLELKQHYSDCLYLNENSKRFRSCLSEPGGFWCQVCPSSVAYWAQELMNLPGRRVSKAKQPEFVPGQTEFLEKLGGKDED
ncbi:unnamed protein product [marine sediment metagenome]|uniref:Uncharacterized protein n=1 Tax=marine sediment metagenome TaxID=412755 RepID=X1TKM9_9ZZZZ